MDSPKSSESSSPSYHPVTHSGPYLTCPECGENLIPSSTIQPDISEIISSDSPQYLLSSKIGCVKCQLSISHHTILSAPAVFVNQVNQLFPDIISQH